MKNLNNMRKNVFATIIVSGLMATSGASIAAQDNKEKDEMKVTPSTPDRILMEDKNIEKMFKVREPGETLVLTIEDVEHDIKITNENGMKVLHVTNADYKDIELIRQTYTIIYNSDNFTINSSFTDDYVNKDEMQTKGTLEAMKAPAIESGF